MIIDRLTFVADWHYSQMERDSDGQFSQLDRALAPLMDITRRGFARWPYRYSFTTADGLNIQTADKNGHVQDLRFDFNPQTCDYKRVLGRFINALESVRVTRLDYAQDYDLDLSRVAWSTTIPVKSCVFRGRSGQLETTYLGAAGSTHRYRIYDKALESGLPLNKWRLESQLRFGVGDSYNDFPPFDSLEFKCPRLEHLKINERAMVLYLLDYPDGIKELGSQARSKYRSLLRADLMDWTIEHPKYIWSRERKKLTSFIERILNLTRYVPPSYLVRAQSDVVK